MDKNKEEFEKGELINGNDVNSDANSFKLREKFISKYTMEKGWDENNLSDDQLLEIKSQKGYQCPGMICS